MVVLFVIVVCRFLCTAYFFLFIKSEAAKDLLSFARHCLAQLTAAAAVSQQLNKRNNDFFFCMP
jgi:hypothetical protein